MNESKINCNLKINKKIQIQKAFNFQIPKDSFRLKGEKIYLRNQKFNIKTEMPVSKFM